MEQRTPGSSFVGLVLLVLGAGFLLQGAGAVNFGNLIGQWWPLLIILFGLVEASRPGRSKTGPLIIILIGGILLLRSLVFVTVDVWSLIWPLILIAIGLSFLSNRTRNLTATSSEDQVELFVLFSGSERRLDSDHFQGGNVTAFFGGAKLDLRKATIAKDAILNVFTAFGGAEIIVPEDCKVITSAMPIFGGWDDKTSHPSNPDSTLRIQGSSVFGGVEIKN